MRLFFWIFTLALVLNSCIGDDLIDDRVDPIIRILNPIDSIAIDSSYEFELSYLNNVGVEANVDADWVSSNPSIISIGSNGLATALSPGSSEIGVSFFDGENMTRDEILVGVGERTVETVATGKKGTVNTTTFYTLKGEFTMEVDADENLLLKFGDDYEASTSIPGLYVYLTNNPNTSVGALEIQAVEVYEGAHTYTIPDVGLEDYGYVLYYCKPFNVKVGDGKIEDL